MPQCIYCGSNKLLNTQLTITLDNGTKHTVSICDEHAEDATIKSAKQAYLDKQDKIKELLEQAKALGLNISESSGGLVVVENKPEPQPESEPQPQPKPQPQPQPQQPKAPRISEEESENGFIPTERVDKMRPIVSSGGNVGGTNVDAHTSYDVAGIRSELPPEALQGKVKMTVVEGREGQPLAVPQQRIDGTGITRINIVKSENDAKLQERFKKMAQSSMSEAPDFARSGYNNSTTNCPMCRGEGIVNLGKKSQMCPKCNGSGIISTF